MKKKEQSLQTVPVFINLLLKIKNKRELTLFVMIEVANICSLNLMLTAKTRHCPSRKLLLILHIKMD